LADELDHFLNAGGTGSSLPYAAGYEILQEAGRRGPVTLYQARDRVSGAVVALRVIDLESCGGARGRADALRAAMQVAQLRHPNLAEIQSVSEKQGRLLLQREWAEAGTLADTLHGRTWTAEEAAALVEALAAGLDCAHRQGVVHHDVRPSNVLLAPDGAP